MPTDPKPDIFRIEYTPLTDEQKTNVLAIKKLAQTLYDLIGQVGHTSRDTRSIKKAKTELEVAVMWAVNGATAPPPPVMTAVEFQEQEPKIVSTGK